MPDLEPTTPPTPVPAANGAPVKPKPKGLLPVPAEVIERVDRYLKPLEADGFVATPEQRDKFIHDYTLQWHYGGDIVVMRHTPQGYEILASGDEVWEFDRNASDEEKQGTVIDRPAVWDGIQMPWFIGEAR